MVGLDAYHGDDSEPMEAAVGGMDTAQTVMDLGIDPHVHAQVLAENRRLHEEIERLRTVPAPKVVTRTPVAPCAAEDRIFAKSHPRHAFARERVMRRLAYLGTPEPATAIVEYLQGAGGVPEFRPHRKNVPNRMMAFGLVRVRRKERTATYWWRPDMPLPRGYVFG